MKFQCEIYVFTAEEGGRSTPFFNDYRPEFNFNGENYTGRCKLLKGKELVQPGESLTMEVELLSPLSVEQGMDFSMHEGTRRSSGRGTVTQVL